MPEVSDVNYFTAAKATGKPVSGSDAMQALTFCVAECDDGTILVGMADLADSDDPDVRREMAHDRAVGVPVVSDPEPEVATDPQ